MAALIFLLLNLVASLFKSKSRLEAENAALRQQLTVLQRKVRGRVRFTNHDRLFFIMLYRWFPSVLDGERKPFEQLRGLMVSFTPNFEILPGTAPKTPTKGPKPFELPPCRPRRATEGA
jgi:hypothetical protein